MPPLTLSCRLSAALGFAALALAGCSSPSLPSLPSWMGGSIDNFWLENAVRYGIPGFLFIAGGLLSVCFGLGRLRNLSFQVAQCRKGLIITICGLAFALCTVHVWDAPYVLIIFLLDVHRCRRAGENERGHRQI